jgi:hypothetical protein
MTGSVNEMRKMLEILVNQRSSHSRMASHGGPKLVLAAPPTSSGGPLPPLRAPPQPSHAMMSHAHPTPSVATTNNVPFSSSSPPPPTSLNMPSSSAPISASLDSPLRPYHPHNHSARPAFAEALAALSGPPYIPPTTTINNAPPPLSMPTHSSYPQQTPPVGGYFASSLTATASSVSSLIPTTTSSSSSREQLMGGLLQGAHQGSGVSPMLERLPSSSSNGVMSRQPSTDDHNRGSDHGLPNMVPLDSSTTSSHVLTNSGISSPLGSPSPSRNDNQNASPSSLSTEVLPLLTRQPSRTNRFARSVLPASSSMSPTGSGSGGHAFSFHIPSASSFIAPATTNNQLRSPHGNPQLDLAIHGGVGTLPPILGSPSLSHRSGGGGVGVGVAIGQPSSVPTTPTTPGSHHHV